MFDMHTNSIYSNRVVLPLKDSFMLTWPGHNFLASVVLNIPTAYDWFMNNFIQLRGQFELYNPDNNKLSLRLNFVPPPSPTVAGNAWTLCPFVRTYNIPRELINKSSLIDFLILSLANGYYISILLDQFFRPGSQQNKSFKHVNYIYGYDIEKKIFYLADHFDYGKYSFAELDFSKMSEAYDIPKNSNVRIKEYENINLFRIDESVEFEFDIKYACVLLNEYLTSVSGFDILYKLSRAENDFKYGLNIYSLIQSYIKDLIEGNQEILKDRRTFTLLLDHKSLMKKRIEYLQQKRYISEGTILIKDICSIEEDAKIILKLFLKYEINNDKDLLYSISKRIDEIKSCEQLFIENLLNELEKKI